MIRRGVVMIAVAVVRAVRMRRKMERMKRTVVVGTLRLRMRGC